MAVRRRFRSVGLWKSWRSIASGCLTVRWILARSCFQIIYVLKLISRGFLSGKRGRQGEPSPQKKLFIHIETCSRPAVFDIYKNTAFTIFNKMYTGSELYVKTEPVIARQINFFQVKVMLKTM